MRTSRSRIAPISWPWRPARCGACSSITPAHGGATSAAEGRSGSTSTRSSLPAPDGDLDLLDLHDALERLAAFDARKSAIVELHFFGGLSYDETAEAMGVSAATVDRELRLAKAWLKVELGQATGS